MGRQLWRLGASRGYVGLTCFLVAQFCTIYTYVAVASFVYEDYYAKSPSVAGSGLRSWFSYGILNWNPVYWTQTSIQSTGTQIMAGNRLAVPVA